MATDIGRIVGTIQLKDLFSSPIKAIGASVGALAAVSVKKFADFDNAMTESLAIMTDVSDGMRSQMEKIARSVATELEPSATEAAESYFFLASAGLDAENSIAALPEVARFASAGSFEMAKATDLLTDAQSALGLTIRDNVVKNMENMIRVSDVLVRANTLANATVEQFSTSLTSEAGAALKSFNIDIEEGVAVLAAFADQGVKAEKSGMGLSRILRLMTSAAVNNKENYDKLGVSVFDATGNIRNMADIIENLEQVLGGLSDEQRVAALEMLGFQARVQGVILPLLGTSSAIRKYEAELRSATGFTKSVSEKQMESFSKQMGLVRDRLIDVAINIGQQLAPKISELAKQLESFSKSNDIKSLGDSIARGFDAIVKVSKFVIENIDLIKSALAALIAIKFWAWAMQIVAGFRAAAAAGTLFHLSLGPIGIALAALTALYVVTASKLKRLVDQQQRDIERMVANARKAGTELDKMRRAVETARVDPKKLQEQIDAAANAMKLAREAGNDQALRIASGQWREATEALADYRAKLLTPGELQATEKSWSDSTAALKKYRSELQDLQRQQLASKDKISGSGEAPPSLADIRAMNAANKARNERIAALEKLIAREETNQKVTKKTIDRAKELRIELGELNEETEDYTTTLDLEDDALKRLRESWENSIKLVSARIIQSIELADATEKGEKALAKSRITIRLWNAALSQGIDPLSAWGEALINAERLLIEAENRAKSAANEIDALTESWDRFNETVSELGPSTDLLPAIDSWIPDTAWEGPPPEWSKEIKDNLVEGIQDAIADGFSNGFQNLDVENLIGSFAKIGSDILAEQLSAAITSAIEGSEGAWKNLSKFATSAAGTAAFAAGTVSNVANAYNTDYAVAGGVIGGIIGGIAGAGAWSWATASIGAWIGSAIGGAIKKGRPIIKGHIEQAASGITIDVVGTFGKMGEEIEQGFDQVLSHIGGEFRGLAAGIVIEAREGMSVIVNGVKHYFDKDSLGEGIQFAIIESLKRADITGISAEARAVLNNTMADTMNELVSDLDFAKFMEQLNLDEAAVAVDNFVDNFLQTWDRMVKLGIDGAARMEQWAVSSLKSAKNNILGIVETESERIKRQSAAHNAQIRLLHAEKTAQRVDLEIRRAEIEAKIKIAQANNELARGQIELEGEFLKARGQLLTAEYQLLDSLVQSIAAIDALLPALLEGLITDDEINAAINRAGKGLGGGVNQKESDLETVESALDDFDLSLLSNVEQSIANINSKWDDLIPKAHGNADLLERIADARQKEINALKQQLVLDPISEWLGEKFGGTFFMSDWEQQEANIRKQFEDAREANRILLQETGERAIEFWRLNMAEIRALQALAEDVIDSLGLPLESTRDRLASLGDATSYLQSQLDGGIISAERFGQVMSELAQQAELELLGVAAGLLDTMGLTEEAAEVRAAMAELEFHINRLQFNTLYEGFMALGIVSEEAAARFEHLFGVINDPENWPSFDPKDFMPKGGSTGSVGKIGSVTDIARERENALEAIKDILRSAMNPYKRDLLELNEQFAEYRRLLGNTPDVLRAYNIALKQLNDRYTKNLRDTLESLNGITETPAQSIASLQAKFDEIIASGDLSRSDELSQIIQQLTQAYGSAYGTAGGGMAALIADIQARAAEFLGESGPANLAKVLEFPVSAVDKVVNSPSPVSKGIDKSNTLLDKIEVNTRRTTDEVKKNTKENITTRMLERIDNRRLLDKIDSSRGVRLGESVRTLRALRKVS